MAFKWITFTCKKVIRIKSCKLNAKLLLEVNQKTEPNIIFVDSRSGPAKKNFVDPQPDLKPKHFNLKPSEIWNEIISERIFKMLYLSYGKFSAIMSLISILFYVKYIEYYGQKMTSLFKNLYFFYLYYFYIS